MFHPIVGQRQLLYSGQKWATIICPRVTTSLDAQWVPLNTASEAFFAKPLPTPWVLPQWRGHRWSRWAQERNACGRMWEGCLQSIRDVSKPKGMAEPWGLDSDVVQWCLHKREKCFPPKFKLEMTTKLYLLFSFWGKMDSGQIKYTTKRSIQENTRESMLVPVW